MTTATSPRSIAAIAADISKDWKATAKKGIYFGAVPYLDAMFSLDKITDNFYADSAESVVIYFLANATTYRGATAKALKAELKALLPKAYR